MNATIVHCGLALVDAAAHRDFAFVVENGRITAIDKAESLHLRFPEAALRWHGSDVAVVPGFINGHSHAYQILLRGWADDLPFSLARQPRQRGQEGVPA